jgi:uncharacterized protein
MNPLEIITKHYSAHPMAEEILVLHSRDVARKAIEIAGRHPELSLDIAFVEEAAMIHDIGIILCDAPEIHCLGNHDYICHGYLGAEIMQKEGFDRHALVCERHTGSGITVDEIIRRNLPIPHRDMLPVSLEEKLVCYADKFFSKNHLGKERPLDKVRKKILKHGEDSLLRFEEMHKLFG